MKLQSVALMGSIQLLLVALSLSQSHNRVEGGRFISKEEDLELERQLKSLNKPPIKTIQTDEGDVIDCIDIHKQPAFDHPLIKNHKIQMRPTSRPKGLINGRSSYVDKHSRSTLRSIGCPQGTVPIQRTQKEDLIRAKSFSNSYATNIHPHSTKFPGQHLTLIRSKKIIKQTYRGVYGQFSIYNPTVAEDHRSTAQMWIENGQGDQNNALQAGWMVEPRLFGDNKTRSFVYWTVNGGVSGCFNLLCSGFVQVNPDNLVGDVLEPTSIYNGTQYVDDMMIFQDPGTGNWWFIHGNADNEVGYWPKQLLPLLVEGASVVAWGGLAKGRPNGNFPPLGSGRFPDGHYNHECSFRQIQVVNTSNYLVNPKESLLEIRLDKPTCYALVYYGIQGGEWGQTFAFGGPGGSCGV